jgi:hypothetical protein
MRCARLLSVLFVCLLAALPARAEVAGQVLAASGEVLALRSGQIIALSPGAPVESGDQIHTGPDGSVQIRFTDWGVVALRARSDFVVDEYVYEARQGGREKAYFSLLNGGVRSVTGLIGRRDHSNYLLRAPTATIGIRGTDYSVRICKQDCRNTDGSLGEDGLYGAVNQGRIAVNPYGSAQLAREFGAGEFFRLANENSIPAPLSSPPPFLPLDPQARRGRPDSLVPVIGGVVPPGGGSPPAPQSPLGPVGGLTPILTSIVPPASSTVAPLVNGAGAQVTGLAKQVVLPAGELAGSTVNTVLSMPALGPVFPLLGTLNSVPVVVPPALPALPPVIPPVALPPLPPVTPPTLPPIGVPPVTIPPVVVPSPPPVTVPPVFVPPTPVPVPPVVVPSPTPVPVPPVVVPSPTPAPIPPVVVPSPTPVPVPPVVVPSPTPVPVPPVVVPAPTPAPIPPVVVAPTPTPAPIPPVVVPTPTPAPIPPVVVPTPTPAPIPPVVVAPAPPPVALPTPPSLPLSRSLFAPLRK